MTSLDQGRRRREPREPSDPDDLQQEWENRELMHAVLKHQFGNGAAIRVGAVFERHVLSEVAAEVARRIDNIPRGRRFLEHRRARFLVDAVKQIVRSGSERARRTLLAEAKDLADLEVKWLQSTGDAVLGLQFRTPAPAVVEAAITRQPMMGRTFGEWFGDWVPRATESKIVARVRAGMLAGESTPQIVRSLQGTRALRHTDGKLVESRRAVTMLTRTTMTHTSNVARDLTFARNADVVPRVRFLATLDLRTSLQCAKLDGKTWAADEPHPNPPIHPNCRSTLLPSIGDPIGKRAALGGRVDARTHYAEWLRTRSFQEQVMVLGRSRAVAFNLGGLSIDDMVDASLSRVITIRELRELQKI
jgi:SPP1 gp7 family putative phage head morphogenesis protein